MSDEKDTQAVDYRSLDATQVCLTLQRLKRRIDERFGNPGLGRVCGSLCQVGQRAAERSRAITRPNWWLRGLAAVVIAGILVVTVLTVINSKPPDEGVHLVEMIQLLEAGLNDVVLIGGAIFFLVTLETRLKRRRVLDAMHELRSIAHIIDMHQLTKDPDYTLAGAVTTASSPRRKMTAFQLGRYLDYCSEMLSLVGKIAALYVQRFDDPVATDAAGDIENLTTGLERKIWQKLMVVRQIRDDVDGGRAEAPNQA